MEITFDPKKAASNLKKHKVSFKEAESVFLDVKALVEEDGDHDEQRFKMLGMSKKLNLLVVVYAVWDEEYEIYRIISARKATPSEVNDYES